MERGKKWQKGYIYLYALYAQHPTAIPTASVHLAPPTFWGKLENERELFICIEKFFFGY